MSLRSVLGYLLLFYFNPFTLIAQDFNFEIDQAYQEAIKQFEAKNWDHALPHFLEVEGHVLSRGVDDWEEMNPSQLAKIRKTFHSIIKIYWDDSNFDKAKIFTRKALAFFSQQYGDNTIGLYEYHHLLAELYRHTREGATSMEYGEKALYLLNLEKDDMPFALDVDSAKAAVYNSLGHIAYGSNLGEPTTMAYYQKSLGLTQIRPDLLPLKIYSLLGQSRFYAEKKLIEKAIVPLQMADSIWQKHQAEFLDHPEYYHVKRKIIRHYGYYWKRQNEYDRAISLYRQYLQLSDQHFKTPRSHIYLLTIMEISEIYRSAWKYEGERGEKGISRGDSSVFYVQKALIKSCDDYYPSSIYDLPKLENIRERQFTFHIIRTLARLNQQLVFERGTTEEKIKALKLANAYIDLADQLFDELLKESINFKGHINQPLLDMATLIYDTSLIFNHYLYQLSPSDRLLDKTFYYIQKMKALQILLDQLKEEALQKTNLPDSIRLQDKAFLQEIQNVEIQVHQAEINKDSLSAAHLKNVRLFDLKRSYENFQRDLDKKYPSYHLRKYQFHPVGIQELKATLKVDEVLLDYAGSQSIGYVIAIDKGETALFEALLLSRSEDKKKMENIIKDFNRLLQRSAMNRKSTRAKFVRLSHYLYQRYLAPIEDILEDKKRMIIIGDGMTNYIPFEVLLAKEELKSFHELDYLVKDYEISYHYSATLFARARTQINDLREGLYTFAPVYDQQSATSKPLASPGKPSGADATIDKNRTLRAFDESGNLLPLPESEREVKAISQLFKDNFPDNNIGDLRTGATENALKENLEKAYRYIHIAGHSFADLNEPLFSGIACYPQPNRPLTNSMLYLGEIQMLNTQADLITLSSCESGFGQALESDGLVGLNRAFVLAGTPNVVFSLWKVYDKVSAKMMTQFYGHILEGKSYSCSLRSVKLNLINDPVTASPHYWSSFLLIGR